MDKKTQKILERISHSVATKHKEAFNRKYDNSYLREIADQVIRKGSRGGADPKLQKIAELVKEGYRKGAYDDYKETQLRKEDEEKMDKEIEEGVRRAIRSGAIPPAQKDSFIKEMEWKLRHKK